MPNTTPKDTTVWVVFSDALNRRLRDEDYIAASQLEAKRHSKDLAKDGHEPVTKTFPSEEAFYVWKEAK